MKKNRVILACLAAVLALTVFPAGGEAASQVDKINKEIKQVRDQMQAASHNRNQAEKDAKTVQVQKVQTAESLKAVMAEIDTVGTRLSQVQNEVRDTTENLQQTAQELDDAEKRIGKQDDRLQSRIRMTYMNGRVSYLEVLLNAASFADFLSRLDSLHTMMSQDKVILEERRHDKELVEEKKKEVESQLTEVKGLYAKIADYQQVLSDKESEKQQLISTYDDKLEELGEISEEQEQLLLDLAAKESALIKKKNALKTYYTGGKLGIPLKASYRISSPFGYRIHPITGKRKLHAGVDMAAPEGTNIYAAESGVVLIAQWWTGYGNCVVIDHGGGLWTIYGHIRNGGIKVEKGETVKRGQLIAEVGSTGNSTGNHLHFEVRKDGTSVNPLPYLK
ncbi:MULTISPECIES: M23 family metallopeptidase [unclassified Paenibacillus]|uniref:murein hydrolase activator EnvC family protein n=1 Tax=unclassified Paenibacillus TaxID=185978 RepID=UPI0009570B57|nr:MULTISPECIES: M23 family metallopeptidase [unclassified Paenibacillus]ASS67196.1 peptidoglycan DD-metalloendopeptidase family protein [Paenibacillus sp. RUD330]SIQ86294.1 Murein DD-endopeptidase MepM and murein hydrolase activator NlpD, contain LysM domain [Paenibacillus sp. RU4X]SIR07329.1 Murein DD-endopeptidase MepM and murein hydrolase activator NlpD, contain LysM domain [Paenibacillus sp. RU4T]